MANLQLPLGHLQWRERLLNLRSRVAAPEMREALLAFCFFLAIAFIFTAPLSLSPASQAVNEGDPLIISWTLAWVAHQLTTNPFRLFDSNAFYLCLLFIHPPAPWVGSQPCGAKYPGFCADSKGV